VRKIIVYGSRARGKAEEYADLDIIILVENKAGRRPVVCESCKGIT